MKKMINSLALIFTIVSLTSCSSESEGVNEPVETAKSYTHNANELELLDKVNEYRVSIGLNPLQIIEHISFKSSEHNDYMLATQTVTH